MGSYKITWGPRKNSRGTLDEKLVKEIRELLAGGLSHRLVAQWCGVSMGQVARISAGYTYWWVTEPEIDKRV